MRIYNGTKSVINLPLTESQRITIPGHSVSGDIMPNLEFLSLLVSSYDYSELALIISGPYEINMCSQVSGVVGFVVQTLDEAIERFAPKEEKKVDAVIVGQQGKNLQQKPKKEEQKKQDPQDDTKSEEVK